MTLSRIIKELCAKYKFSHELMPHDLRLLYATHFLENGVDLYQISRFIGHENLSTTQSYLHLTKANLKKIYDKYIDIK